jgi:hypothetical protein
MSDNTAYINHSLAIGRAFMAKVIEFYVPVGFRKKATKWIRPEQQGRVIAFGMPQKKSA